MRKHPLAHALDRPRTQLDVIARAAGCHLSTVADVEQLAGVDVQSFSQRSALWDQFAHLSDAPLQRRIDAVMDYCASIALRRLARGELCLIPTG